MTENEGLRRLVWTTCQMRGEGVVAHGEGQGVTPMSQDGGEWFVINANGIDYVVICTVLSDFGWTVEDVGSVAGRHLNPEEN